MSIASTARHTRRVRVTALALVGAVLGVLLSVVAPAPAGAADGINGVEYVHFEPNPYTCEVGGNDALPCLPDAGNGKSNTVYVHQTQVGGEYQYTHLTGTNNDPTRIWVQTTLEARCKPRFRLSSAYIENGGTTGMSGSPDSSGSGGADPTWPQPVNPDNRTIPLRHIALHQNLEQFLFLSFGLSGEEFLQWGEDRVAVRVAQGVTEEEARLEADSFTLPAVLSATVRCRQISGMYSWPGWENVEWKRDATAQPITFVFLAAGMEPGDEDDPNWRDAQLPTPTPPPTAPRPDADQLIEEFRVTEVHLSAIPDSGDACRLHLSGVVSANGPGEITYRFVDDLGVGSQLFTADIDHTGSVILDHEVQLDPVQLGDGGTGGAPGGLVTQDDGQIGGYVHEQGDNVQGYYRLVVTEPHDAESEVASYNVDGCTEGGRRGIGGTVELDLPGVPATRG